MWKALFTGLCLVFGTAGPAAAHFGMVIPSVSTVSDRNEARLTLTLSFSHPMDMQGMPLARPKVFKVVVNGGEHNLTDSLQPATVADHEAWTVAYDIRRPGVHQFVMEPVPYWEPAEDRYIIHYTKTCVAAFGDEDGWDEPVGLKTEIVPLTRPFGNYAGNVFQGQVLLDGRPVPYAEVEVEYYNQDRAWEAPNPYLVTQVIRADANAVFTYGVPFAGWWGFAALTTSPDSMEHDGKPKSVELGAVLWTEFVNPQQK